ncbi:MAG: C25 family cysteine peptidase [Bacteroidota bacterium]
MLRYLCFLMALLSGTSSFSQTFRNEWIDYSKTYYKFPVAAEGLFRITKATLATLNISEAQAQDFQLWRDGTEQPIFTTESTGPLSATGYIEFYGKPLDGSQDSDLFPNPEHHVYKNLSFFSDTAWYYLTINPGNQNLRFVNEANTVATTQMLPDSFFMHSNSINFFRGGFSFNYSYGYAIVPPGQQPGTSSFVPIRSSIWDQGEGFASTPFNANSPLNIAFNGLQLFKNGPSMKVFYSVIGGWQIPNRTISVVMNDSILSSVDVPTYELRKGTVENIPLSRVTNDATNIKFISDNGNWPEQSQANALILTYPRKFHFANQRVFSFQLPVKKANSHLRVSNFLFGAMPPVLLDLTNFKRYIGVTKADSSLFEIQPSGSERKMVLANQADFIKTVAPTAIKTMQFTDYMSVANQGDYLIITSNKISDYDGKNQVDEYRQYRSSYAGGGFNVKVVDIEELYDQFSLGVRKNPLSIRHFIQFAAQKFASKPKFVFLIGRGVDYLGDRYSGNYAGRELLNSVPTWGSPASDNLLAAGANTLNPTPLVPISRLSVVNGKEIYDYLQKVKQFEKLSASTVYTPENKEWKKQFVHINGIDKDSGPDSIFLSTMFSSYLNNFKKIVVDTLIGANVTTYVKANNPNFASEVKQLTDQINNGVGMLNYYGHSSSSSLNFNLSSPEEFTNTNGKYPVVIVNGCKAGNLFTINGNRLQYYGLSISERFVLAPSRGAIGFVSNSDFGLYNYLNIFTSEWLKSASRNNYGKGLGVIQQDAVKKAIAITGPLDYRNRLNLEQSILHGDPAVVVFPEDKPDYTVTDKMVTIRPLNATVAEDSLIVKAVFQNLGKAIKDSVYVEISREFPDGKELLVTKVLLRNLKTKDSVTVKIPVKGLFDKGTNFILATIDPSNDYNEMSESNNTARIPFEVSDEEIRPVFPYKYAIVNKPGFLLTGSTVNPIQEERTYRLQVDTSDLFNSPMLYTKDTTTIGGAVNYNPAISWTNGTVYYWRLAPVFDGTPVNWRASSFQYLPGVSPGWGQSHFYQHTKSELKKIAFDSVSRKQKFANTIQNLYIVNSIYGYSGDEDNHFSISVNGDYKIYSACVGRSIIFNVFDTLTMTPWYNPNQRYGSGALCNYGREFNFEFPYYPASNRKKIMDFLDSIPKGMIVTARLTLDPPYDSSLVKYWQKDTTIFGAGKSLYHSLYNQGFYQLDSMNRYRTFSFVFKKDDSLTLKPLSRLSAGLFDRINTSYFVTTKDTIGEVISPVFGPSKQWKEMHWSGNQPAGINSMSYAEVQLIGIDKNKKETILKIFKPGEWVNDISMVDAQVYPFVRLKLKTSNQLKAVPYQLEYWRLFYEPVSDGALSARDHFVFEKSILSTGKDSLDFQIAFKNIGNVPLDSCSVTITIANREGLSTVYKLSKLRPLIAGDTAIVSFKKSTENMSGAYYALIQVNKEAVPVEQELFNNFAYLPFEVNTLLPVTLVDFTAKSENASVRLDWKVSNETDVATYTVEHSSSANSNFSNIGNLRAKNSGAANVPYQLLHQNPVEGANYYRLKITYQSGKIEYSPVRQINFSRSVIVSVYPNPFTEKISVSALGNQSWVIEMFNVQGQRILTRKGAGSSTINTQNLAAGTYLLKLTDNNSTTVLKLEKQH